MTNYRRNVTAAVTFARQDWQYRQYIARGWKIAAATHLADKFGTWVGHDAQRAMGHA